MMQAIQWVRSLIFIVQMYVAMVVLAVVFLIPMLIHPRGAWAACKSFCWWVIWTAKWMVGITTEVRGTPPTDEVMVAAKHQSFFDIIIIFYHMPWPKFIMKRQLLFSPILGQYAYRLGCVPVDRG
ncbi:MAG: 1-acyl-sn-glycerol-3-phosphate acyltransferase, partial [Pseudomonadota bacterium]